MGGARRQIFIVFAVLMMVQKFGYNVSEMTVLLLAVPGLAVGRLVEDAADVSAAADQTYRVPEGARFVSTGDANVSC